MSTAWIVLSTKWEFANVQATINVIISILGTISIWVFSRFWWQRGSSRVINKQEVPLSRLYTPSTPGDVLDVILLLGKRVFSWRHFPLLTQLIVIITLTAVITLGGPIARYALRSGHIVRQGNTHGLSAVRGAGPLGNRVSAQVIWNETIQSLDKAGYPRDQLMDFVPQTQQPWVYREGEWDPTWKATCTNSEEQPLNITADFNYTMTNPLEAFPAFKKTLHPGLLNSSVYRLAVDWCGWLDWSQAKPIRDFVMFVLIQSEPMVDEQLNKNQNSLFVSVSAIRIHDAHIVANYGGFSGRSGWRINGTIGNASYTRMECTFNRKQQVANELMIPWPWTNDTSSIAMGFADYYRQYVGVKSANNQPIPLPSPDELVRFYQAYMAVMSTGIVTPMVKTLSLALETVELSSIFLAFMLLFTILALVGTTRYTIFYHLHKKELEDLFVPDAKLDWMVHVSKASETLTAEELAKHNREHFQSATFGCHPLDMPLRRPGRVRTMSFSSVNVKGSVSSAAGIATEKDRFKVTISDYSMRQEEEGGSDIIRIASSDVPASESSRSPSRSVSFVEPVHEH